MEWTNQKSQGCLFQTEMFWFYSDDVSPIGANNLWALIGKFIGALIGKFI